MTLDLLQRLKSIPHPRDEVGLNYIILFLIPGMRLDRKGLKLIIIVQDLQPMVRQSKKTLVNALLLLLVILFLEIVITLQLFELQV